MNMTMTSPSNITRALSHVVLACWISALVSSSVSEAATIGHWRFGDDPDGFLADSGPNGLDLTVPGFVTQEAVPAGGRGSEFDVVAGNSYMANFPAGANGGLSSPRTADNPALTLSSGFTVEALVNINRDDNVPLGTLNRLWTIAGQYAIPGNQRSWSLSVVQDQNQSAQLQAGDLYMNISTDGINLASISSNSIHVLKDKDYYLAAQYSPGGTITFFARNLTDGTLEIETVSHTRGVVHDTSADLVIGELGSGGAASLGFRGKIDEVRLSNSILSRSQLLVAVPEPSTGGLLLGLITLAAIYRARHDRRSSNREILS